MESIEVHQIVDKDGEVCVKGLPCQRGDEVKITITYDTPRRGFTAKELLDSGLVGMWKDREDIGDSSEFSRRRAPR